MKKAIVIVGISGGVGSKLLKTIEKNDIEMKCCGISRRRISSTLKQFTNIQADFTEHSSEWICIYREWLREVKNEKREVALVLASGDISPIAQINNLGCIEANIAVNITAQVNLVRIFVNEIGDSCRIKIIQLDSGAAYHPISGWSLYCSAKAYMSMFLKTLALECPYCRIVLLDPGVLDTHMQEIIREAKECEFPDIAIFKNYKEKELLRSPEYVANIIYEDYVAAWNCSEICVKIK